MKYYCQSRLARTIKGPTSTVPLGKARYSAFLVMMGLFLTLLLLTLLLSALLLPVSAETVIVPGATWTDSSGNVIQAHGGGILKVLSSSTQS